MRVHARIGAAAAAAASIPAAACSIPGLGAASVIPPCEGSELTGSFRAISGSAGNLVYRLRGVNARTRSRFVTGIPLLTLLDNAGHKLPTKAGFASPPGTLSAVVVSLDRGGSASSTARFSPAVRGPDEQTSGPREESSYGLRVAPSGGGALVVPLRPPTPVCVHGSVQLSVLAAS